MMSDWGLAFKSQWSWKWAARLDKEVMEIKHLTGMASPDACVFVSRIHAEGVSFQEVTRAIACGTPVAESIRVARFMGSIPVSWWALTGVQPVESFEWLFKQCRQIQRRAFCKRWLKRIKSFLRKLW